MTDTPTDLDALAPDSLLPTLDVRACQTDDLRALEWSGAFTEHRAIIERTFERQQAGEAVMLLAVTRDAAAFPVGQVWLDFARRRDRALIWAVRTHPSLIGRGIGAGLMRRAEAVALARGRVVAELGVEKANRPALRFYRRLGYRPAGEFSETCRYRTPEGGEREWTIDQWRLRRRLKPGPTSASRSRPARSRCAGPSATFRPAASRR